MAITLQQSTLYRKRPFFKITIVFFLWNCDRKWLTNFTWTLRWYILFFRNNPTKNRTICKTIFKASRQYFLCQHWKLSKACRMLWDNFVKTWIRRLQAGPCPCTYPCTVVFTVGIFLTGMTKNVWLSEFWWLKFDGWVNCQIGMVRQKWRLIIRLPMALLKIE